MLCEENTSEGKQSHRKILGKLWDCSSQPNGQKMQADQLVTFGPYRFAPQTGQLWKGKQEVRLTPKAAAVLRYVVERSGQMVTKDELFQSIWIETVVSDSALTSCVQEIRQALRDNARKPRYLDGLRKAELK